MTLDDMDAPKRYGGVAIALHWTVALLLLAQMTLGWWMIEVPKSPPGLRAGWFNLHKSIGLTVGLLALLRLAWRWGHLGYVALSGNAALIEQINAVLESMRTSGEIAAIAGSTGVTYVEPTEPYVSTGITFGQLAD